jgi:hypothetical protein
MKSHQGHENDIHTPPRMSLNFDAEGCLAAGHRSTHARLYLHATNCYRVAEFLLIWPKEKLYGGAIRNILSGQIRIWKQISSKIKKGSKIRM